jgi:hypothetical protein
LASTWSWASGEVLAHGPHRLDVVTGLDLELDPYVAGVEGGGHGVEQRRGGGGDAEGDARRDEGARRAEARPERPALGPELGVEHGHLERRLGHRVALHGGQRRHDVVGAEVTTDEPRGEVVAEHVGRAVGVLARVQGLGHGDALAPALGAAAGDAHEHGLALDLGAVRRAERRGQRQRHAPQLDGLDPHAASRSSVGAGTPET